MSRHLTREERRDIRAVAAKMIAVGTEPVFVVNDRTVLAVLQGNKPPSDPAEKSAEIERMVKAFDFDGQRASTVRDLRSRLLAPVVEGTLYLPMGEPCDGWDPAKGCPGHDVQEAE